MPLRRCAQAAAWTALFAATVTGCRTNRGYQPGPDTYVTRPSIALPWQNPQGPAAPPVPPDGVEAPLPPSEDAPELINPNQQGRGLPPQRDELLPPPAPPEAEEASTATPRKLWPTSWGKKDASDAGEAIDAAAPRPRVSWTSKLPGFGRKPVEVTEADEPVVAQAAPVVRRPAAIAAEGTPVSHDPYIRRQQTAAGDLLAPAPESAVPQRLPAGDEGQWSPLGSTSRSEITETSHATSSPLWSEFQVLPGTGSKSGVQIAPAQPLDQVLEGPEPLIIPAD